MKPTRIALLLLLGLGGALAQAQDANLLVSHVLVSVGADGLKRTTEFSERVYRRENMVWVERVIPQGAHTAEEHRSGGPEHKHLDVAAAARWISRDERGNPQLKLVSSEDKAIVSVASADYGNVGFDGSWASAYHLSDPAVLKKMTPGPRTSQGRWYSQAGNGGQMRLLWNDRLQLPMQIESQDVRGLSRKVTRVQAIPAPRTLPWTGLNGYATKDYSDFLD
ncbi:MAG: hypothetical protein JWQ03_827 [Variovorax sp.]|nr:hypothetical protein [Variovorax sp.]